MAKALPNFQNDNTNIEDAVLDVGAEDVSGIIEDIDAQLASVLAELGGDKLDVKFTLKIYRVVPDRGELAWLFDCVPAELPLLKRLRDGYCKDKEKGSRFEARVYRNNRIYRRIPILIDPPDEAVKHEPEKQSDLATLVAALAAQQQQMFAQLKDTILQVVGKPVTPPPSQMDMMMQTVTLMKGMKDVMGGNQPVAQQSDPKEYIDVLLRGMEMGRENSSSGSSMTDVLRDAVKAIPLLTQMNSPAMPRQRPPQPAPSITPPVDPKEPEIENVNINDAMIKHYIGVLVQKAQQDSDPALYADFILDNAPDNIIEQYLMREDLIDTLNKIDPRVLIHKEWFMELRNHLHEALTAPDEDNDNMVHEPLAPQQSTTDTIGIGGDETNT